jgi:2-dehydro-3-deoxyphosphooctonate aldolase (KDO 8-P synthase)
MLYCVKFNKLISFMQTIRLNGFEIANDKPFTLIAGPCMMESKELVMDVAARLVDITKRLGINLIFKSSFDKANRTSIDGVRGIGIHNALPIFQEIKDKFSCPVITDVHSPEQCDQLAGVIDVLQIPAFLCRQTDLLMAAAKTNRIINVKKGQFLAPWDMKNVAEKIASTGNKNIMLTERGVTFGYNRLISDMRALPVMAETGYPVIFDATHSVQEPGGAGTASCGERHMVKTLAKAAVAVGVAGLFMETHPDPESALSDAKCQVYLNDMEDMLKELQEFDKLAKKKS